MNGSDFQQGSSMIPPELILHAYSAGMFPMGMPDGTIGWFSPDPRAIIPLDPERFHVSKTLAKTVRKGVFEIRVNTAFEDVIDGCAGREETWIDGVIRATYLELHRRGSAHSVEAWREGELAGGLYGVSIGGAFFGESMFHRQTDASKVALVALVERLRERGFTLLDTQWTTSHLLKFGCHTVPIRQYRKRLEEALGKDVSFVDQPG